MWQCSSSQQQQKREGGGYIAAEYVGSRTITRELLRKDGASAKMVLEEAVLQRVSTGTWPAGLLCALWPSFLPSLRVCSHTHLPSSPKLKTDSARACTCYQDKVSLTNITIPSTIYSLSTSITMLHHIKCPQQQKVKKKSCPIYM